MRFKRLGIVLCFAAAIGLGAIVLPSFVISTDSARDAIAAQVANVTGLEASVRGPVAMSLLPPDTVRLTDVVLGGAGPKPALTVDVLTARLRLLPLLIGRIEVASITLERPHIVVALERDGSKSNWTGVIDSLALALRPNPERVRSFSEIHIAGGTMLIDSADRKMSETVTNIDMSLAWPSISKSFAATGQFMWRSEVIETSVGIADFHAALTGDTSGLKYRLSSPLLKVAFDGTLSAQPTVKTAGVVAIDAPSLRDALRWIGATAPPGEGFGRFTLKAQATSSWAAVALNGVQIELDGNVAEGVLAYSDEGRRSIQGTLAADRLDLTGYARSLKLTSEDAREWNRRLIVLDGMSDIDLDLRLSGAQVTIGEAKLERAAFTANLRSGQLAINVGEAQAYGGTIAGSVTMTKSEAGADIKAAMRLTNIDLAPALGQLIGLQRVEGKGDLTFALDGTGTSIDAMTRTLGGTITLTAAAGALNGINVEQLLRRLERRPLSGAGDFRIGRTPFDKLNVTLKITQGIATADTASLESPAIRVSLGGTSSVSGRELDMQGTAGLINRTDAPNFELPFVLQGSWGEPILLPDTQSLLQQSGAAAPLLDAVGARRNRGPVRTTIDRLIGSGQAKPAQAPSPAPAASSGP